MFKNAAHRHDRGWPHSSNEESDKKPRWRTVGIFHFRHDEGDEG